MQLTHRKVTCYKNTMFELKLSFKNNNWFKKQVKYFSKETAGNISDLYCARLVHHLLSWFETSSTIIPNITCGFLGELIFHLDIERFNKVIFKLYSTPKMKLSINTITWNPFMFFKNISRVSVVTPNLHCKSALFVD